MGDNLEEKIADLIESETKIANYDSTDDFLYQKDISYSDECSYDEFKDEDDVDEDYVDFITHDHIKQISNELGLITLCWPEITTPIFDERTQFPLNYYTNSEKEKLTLLYAENFRRQFVQRFPNRRQLILACDNECGIQKFVCNTISPTTLPYHELKNWKDCAQFVSDHITFEELEKITIGPDRIIGPYTTVKRQLGHCFEIATVLCSLLLGNGYDAYVCSGYAKQDITCNIRIRTECPVKTDIFKEEVKEEESKDTKYKLRPERDLRSQFLLYMAQREIDKVEGKKRQQLEKERLEREERERAPYDELHGWRVHGWVLLLPKLDVNEPTFIEPSTGEYYPISTKVYTSLESVWNTENYWVNLQDCLKGLGNLQFDLTDLNCWEHIFPGEPIRHRIRPPDADDTDESPDMDEKHLDMPSPWSEAIDLPHEMLTSRYPMGGKITKFKRTIVQQYGDYVQVDGLKHRINIYSDFECKDLLRFEDTFVSRIDCVMTVVTDLKTNWITEYFRRGREDCCKKHVYDFNRNTLESPRVMEFYSDFRLDGLTKLELDPLFMKTTFVNREDKLISRHVVFAPRGQAPPGMTEGVRRIPLSITERFARNLQLDADDDIAVREFALIENEIYLKYHYAKGHVTASTRDFVKPNVAEMGDSLTFNPDLTTGYQAKIADKPPRTMKLFYLLEAQLQAEQKVLYNIREVEDEVNTFIRTRAVECAVPQVEVSLFNQEMNDEFKIGLKERELQQQCQQKREVDEDIDYLAPYLVRFSAADTEKLTKDQAFDIRNACLKEFKELLVFRANKLRQQFDKIYSEFQKKQNWFAVNVSMVNVDDEEKLLNELAGLKYKLQLYNVRLQRYKDLSPFRYKALETYLVNDQRLDVIKEDIIKMSKSYTIPSFIK